MVMQGYLSHFSDLRSGYGDRHSKVASFLHTHDGNLELAESRTFLHMTWAKWYVKTL
jgi:hypothetical protein